MPELDESDREIIRRETTRKLYLLLRRFGAERDCWHVDRWSQPFDLYKTVIICSLAAAVQ